MAEDTSQLSEQAGNSNSKPPSKFGGLYSHWVLFVLVLVYIFNFIDRNILSILAEDIKADLGVSDAEMGFLYGTAFAVFYAVFGIPLARFADVWVRRSLVSVGLLFWSAMTALSGLARSFPVLAMFRIGVGIGEASASPAAYSMLSDYYAPRHRATVIGIYSSGVYIGGGIGLMLGGLILDNWAQAFPQPGSAPFGLKGWHVAFMAVGVPGMVLAGLVRLLREPMRGASEGLITAAHPEPFKVLKTELAAVIPPFTIWSVYQHGASVKKNLLAAMMLALVAWGLAYVTGNILQWVALAIAVYVTISWLQGLSHRDPASFGMLFHSKALIFTTLAFPTMAFVAYGTSFWTAPFLMRVHEASAADIGWYVGIGNAMGGLIGVVLGGVLGDRLKLKMVNGRLLVGFITILTTAPLILWMLYTEHIETAYWLNFAYHIPASMWVSIAPATANDLVMPRMRATAGAWFLLMNTIIGLALGPYLMGRLSDYFIAQGADSGSALTDAIASAQVMFILTAVLLVLAMRYLPADEASRLERAEALGEKVEKAATE
ncbi:MAG: MFS transporter [Gammaproteobacteria bacterium]|jgi:MFS family permease|nr:MFS transporter [Gammaproteobacteria bacterium]MBT5202410.1 MFS transporter [Gammaproteobacteria bacterium]MBT5601630.1 MFS transporter [Gammaproteobacteria bacterium]MBT6246831.1 MFS transporter [Gammaproteobacteria bacterium]